MNYLIRAGNDSLTLADTLDYVCRSFETLFEAHGLNTHNLQRELEQAVSDKVKEILKSAATEIRSLATAVAKNGDHKQQLVLDQIASRVQSNPANIVRDFGLAVAKLLELFDLPDLEIVENYLASASGGETGLGNFPASGGSTVHRGYLELQGGQRVQSSISDIPPPPRHHAPHHLEDASLPGSLQTDRHTVYRGGTHRLGQAKHYPQGN